MDDAALAGNACCAKTRLAWGGPSLSSHARSAAPVIGLFLQIGWATVPSEAIGIKNDPDSISNFQLSIVVHAIIPE